MLPDSHLRLLRRAWHPVALTRDLPFNAVREVKLLGQELVMARLSDGLLAADLGCPHKGTKLSLGSVADGDLQCPTHCWRFDSEGNCTNLPPLLDNSLNKMAAASLRIYGVQEKNGLIWVQLDEDNTQHPLEIPEIVKSKWLTTFGEPQRFQCGPRRALEGFLDVSSYTRSNGRLPNLYLEFFNGTSTEAPGFAARADFTLESEDELDPLNEAHERTYRGFAPGMVTLRQKWSYGERLWFLLASPRTLEETVLFWGIATAPHFEGPETADQLERATEELQRIQATCESQLPAEIPYEPERGGWGILVTPGDVLSDQFERAYRLWTLVLAGKAGGSDAVVA